MRSSSARGSGRKPATNSWMSDSSRRRTWGTPSTAWWAISWRQTHSRRSSAGRLHSSPKASMVGTTQHELVARRAGDRAGRTGRSCGWPGGRPSSPAVMPSIIGVSICMTLPSQAAVGSPAGSSNGSTSVDGWPARRWPGTGRATWPAARTGAGRRRGWPATQRVRVTGTMVQRPAGDRRGEPGGVGDTCRSATRASCSSSNADRGVDVRLGLAAGGDRVGELAGGVPGDRALLLDQAGQVAEERHPLEGVVGPEWIILRHGGMVCGWLRNPTAMLTASRGRDRRDRRRGGARPPAVRPAGRGSGRRHGRGARPRVGPGRRPADRPAGRRREGPGRRRDDGGPPRLGVRTGGRRRPRDRSPPPTSRWPAGCSTRRRPPGRPTSSCCRRPPCTAPGPTTRCRSPRTPPLRPDPGLAFAVQKAEIERLTSEWRDQHPGTTVTVLRPATAGRRRPARLAGPGPAGRRRGAQPRRRPAGAVPPPRRPRRRRRPGCARPPRRRLQRGPRRLAHADRVPRAGGRHRQGAGARLAGRPDHRPAVAAPARRRAAARGARLRPRAVGGRQRPAAGGRLGADRRQRGGLRRGRARRARSPRSAPAAARSSRSAPPASLAAGVAVGAVALVRRARRRR